MPGTGLGLALFDQNADGPVVPGRNPRGFFRYLPAEPEDAVWGVRVVDAGYGRIAPGAPYPPAGHPNPYAFDWAAGRVIPEFQLVYILAGQGRFESRSGGARSVGAGQGFILFPGEWHRYRPAPDTGWTEVWVGFEGDYAGHIARHCFSPERPTFHGDAGGALASLLRRVAKLVESPSRVDKTRAALGTLEAMACLRHGQSQAGAARERVQERVDRARLEILANSAASIDWPRLAQSLGMSYPDFRRTFRRHTGKGPHHYQMHIRLSQAEALLADPDISVKEVAERVGFASPFYFSRLFKKKRGLAPDHWRRQRRAARAGGASAG